VHLMYNNFQLLVYERTISYCCLVNEKPGNGFHIDLEDYLMGLLQLASELVSIPLNIRTLNAEFIQ
jgi:hypothetical protein